MEYTTLSHQRNYKIGINILLQPFYCALRPVTRVSQKNRIQIQVWIILRKHTRCHAESEFCYHLLWEHAWSSADTTDHWRNAGFTSEPAQSSSYYIISSLSPKKKAKKYFLHNSSSASFSFLAPQVSCFA